MRALIQRVRSCSVEVEGRLISETGPGLFILLGVFNEDKPDDLLYTIRKCSELRIFEDDLGKMNLSVVEIGGEVMAVSQFTLCANTAKGRRPGFGRAMEPVQAEKYYQDFCRGIENSGLKVKQGIFGAKMLINIQNDGPVTILIDSRER
ncbi:D-tyrosyl-tRNA(Tyr) deacylase [bacterium]|nr:D-tyrosyl-tRNA(Tyr) deacylase [bacterium]